MYRFGILSLLAIAAASAAVESDVDLPLGTVIAVADDAVTVDFGTVVDLGPDDVLAIYGPGLVEKHPLNDRVVLERRKLVGKVQILSPRGAALRGRVVWLADGVELAPGFDAVPLPGEASPDAPPVLEAEVAPIQVPAQGTVRLRLPIVDPEGSAVHYRWQLAGTPGHGGLLAARHTAAPEVWYAAPGTAGSVTVQVVASDAHGQRLEVEQPIEVSELTDDWRKRGLQIRARLGGDDDAGWRRLSPGPDGGWWGVDVDGRLRRVDAGWNRREAVPVQEDAGLREATEVVARPDRVLVLDERSRAVAVLGRDGVVRGRLGGLVRPSDLAVDSQGTIYVADHEGGGVMVYEADGRFRCRLGRKGHGADEFNWLTRIAIGPDDELCALDSEGFRVHRFDRVHRRLASLDIQGDRDIRPLDLAAHPDGLLVLMADGRIQVFGPSGMATRALPSVVERGFFEDLDDPGSIAVDGLGDIVVTYPREGILARYDDEGRLSGVRGGRLWELQRFAVDGRGFVSGLEERSGVIARFDPQGWLVTRFAGTERYDGPFEEPGAMAVAPDGSTLAVIDVDKIQVLRFDLAAPHQEPFVFGQDGENPGQFEEPIAIAVDGAGRSYVLDAEHHRVVVFDAEGRFLFNLGRYDRGRERDELDEPLALAVAPDGGTLYVYDGDRYEIMKFVVDQDARSWRHVSNAGGRGRELGQFDRPVAMACDRQGLLYVADTGREDLQVIDFRGSNAVTVHVADFEALGLDRIETMALGPDGLPWLFGGGRATALWWR